MLGFFGEDGNEFGTKEKGRVGTLFGAAGRFSGLSFRAAELMRWRMPVD